MLKDARIKWNSNHCSKVVFDIRILSWFPQPQQPQTWPKKFEICFRAKKINETLIETVVFLFVQN